MKEEAKKIEFSYDYTKTEMSNSSEGSFTVIDFKITAYNLNENIKPLIIYNYYQDDYREFKYNSSKISSLSGFSDGEKVQVTFKAYTTDECSGKTVYTKMITLPYYNTFYNSDECKENPNFKYCQDELLTSSLTYSQFLNELNEYLKPAIDEPVIDNSNDNANKINVNEIIGLIILLILIVLALIMIILKIRKVRVKNKL